MLLSFSYLAESASFLWLPGKLSVISCSGLPLDTKYFCIETLSIAMIKSFTVTPAFFAASLRSFILKDSPIAPRLIPEYSSPSFNVKTFFYIGRKK